MSTQRVWRNPPEESADLYPGLVVCDNRQSGSITLGASRLPAWAIIADLVERGWKRGVLTGWPDTHGVGEHDFSAFLFCLLDMRGEFGRLLLMLAAASNRQRGTTAWWDVKRNRKQIIAQLRVCIEALEATE